MSSYPDWSSFDWDTARPDDKNLLPGDPYEIAMLGKRMRDVAEMIDTQAGRLRNLVDGNGWDSDAGHAFQKQVGDTADLLRKSHTRYAAAADALGSSTSGSAWAGELEGLQSQAAGYIAKGREAYAEGKATKAKIGALPKDASHSDKKALSDQQTDNGQELAQWQKKLEGLIDTRDSEAKAAADAIRHAIDHDGLKNPPHHWWDGWQDLVADIGHWAGVAAAVLGVAALLLSWVPVVGEVLGALAAIASVVALVADTISAIDGKGTWLDVGIDAIGVLSFGAGRVLGEGAKAAEAAAKGADTLEEAQGLVKVGTEAGLSEDDAWDMVSAFKGDEIGDSLLDVAGGPKSILPDLKTVVAKSVNPKVYVQAIKDSSQEWGEFGLKNAGEYFKGLTNPYAGVKGLMNSPFKVMAVAGRSTFFASQTLPLAAGWANLAVTDEPSNPVTGLDFFSGVKEIPGIGASGIPGVNWSWSK